MALYSAYFDESSDSKSPVYVVAGFLSNDAHWSQFEKEWKEVLREFQIVAFHAQHWALRKGEFRGWDESKRRHLMASLLDIIQRRAQFGFATVVHASAFKRIFQGKDRIAVGSIYNLCCSACFAEIGEWAQRTFQIEPIAHIFDIGHKNAGEVLRNYQGLQPKKVEYRLGPISFESDETFVPLQAADLAAYELWKWLDEHFANKTRHGRYPLQEIIRVPWRIREFDESILFEILDKVHGKPVNKRSTIHNVISALRPGVVQPPET